MMTDTTSSLSIARTMNSPVTSTVTMNTNKIHHYEEPLTLLKKSSIAHFTDKYDNLVNKAKSLNQEYYHQNQFIQQRQYEEPIVNQQQQQQQQQKSTLRSSKSLGSLNTNNLHKKKSLIENKSLTTSNDLISNGLINGQDLLDETELNQIELFFRSNKTYVYACRCMANLYITKTDLVNGGRISNPRSHEWELIRTGIPVIVFDKGETRSRNKRQLQIFLAERGTGFALWKDIIDNLTDYRSIHPTFHTLYLSCDHRKMAGLSFDNIKAAETFLNEIESITSNPINIALSVPTKKLNKNLRKNKIKVSTKLPLKCDISTPCLFQHVTNVDLKDFTRFQSVTTLYPNINMRETFSQKQINNDYQQPQQNQQQQQQQRRQSALSLNESHTIASSPSLIPSSNASSTASSSITSESSSQFSL